jgi:hypothetical protein
MTGGKPYYLREQNSRPGIARPDLRTKLLFPDKTAGRALSRREHG